MTKIQTNLSVERLHVASVCMRRDSHYSRAAHMAVILGKAEHPDDAEAALAKARSICAAAPASAKILHYLDDAERVARTYTDAQLISRLNTTRGNVS